MSLAPGCTARAISCAATIVRAATPLPATANSNVAEAKESLATAHRLTQPRTSSGRSRRRGSGPFERAVGDLAGWTAHKPQRPGVTERSLPVVKARDHRQLRVDLRCAVGEIMASSWSELGPAESLAGARSTVTRSRRYVTWLRAGSPKVGARRPWHA